MTATAWPYLDVDPDDLLTRSRIPVTGRCPRYGYIAAFHGVPDPILDDGGELPRPTVAEAAMISAYIDYIRDRTYRPGWQERLLAAPLDADPGHNTLVLHKYEPDDWGYRWSTWDTSWFFPPAPRLSARRKTLVEVLDHASSFGSTTPHPSWVRWKTARPEVFAP